MWWVSTPFNPVPAVSVAQIHSFPVMLRSITLLYQFPLNCEAANQVKLTPSLSVFLCHSQGGATVTVHPGLQGDVQAFTGGAAEERVGCVRGADPWRGQRSCAAASERSHIWIQSPPLLQWIPGNRQWCQNWQDSGRRWGGCQCVRVFVSACMCACMFPCLHNFICTAYMWDSVQQLFTAGSKGRVVLCSHLVYSSMLRWMFSSLKGPNTTLQCKCYNKVLYGVVVAVSWGLVETQLHILICSDQLREMWALAGVLHV